MSDNIETEVEDPKSDLQSELSQMIEALGGKPQVESDKPEVTDNESKEDPKANAEEKSEETETVEAVEKPKEGKPKVEIEPDEKDKTINELRSRVVELETVKVEQPKPAEQPKVESPDFVGDLDLDEVTRDPSKLNEVLNKVYAKAIEDAQRVLPDQIKTHIAVIESVKEATKQFYEENSDLKQFQKVVQTVFEELAAKDPSRTVSDVIKLVAPEVRKRLELPEPKPKSEVKEEKPKLKAVPSLPGKSGRAGRVDVEEPKTNTLQDELEEMNKSLRR